MEYVLLVGFLLALLAVWPHLTGSTAKEPPPKAVPDERKHKPRPIVTQTAGPWSGPAVLTGPAFVTDGDSLVIRQVQVRLFGIDAPELNHPHGKRAKSALMTLCRGQNIRAELSGQDVHGRTVARCFLQDGRDLSAEMVRLGLAIDWAKFSHGEYRSLETPDARKNLWLADARQKGRMHVWDQFEARQKAREKDSNGGGAA